MAKKKVRHQSFKLTPHKYPKEKVLLFLAVAFVIGFSVGWLLRAQIAAVLGVSTF